MKVCLLNDSFPPVIDGVANVVLNYAKILKQDQLAEVLVGTPEYPDTDYSVYPYKVVPYQSFDTTKIVRGYRAGNPLDIREIKDMVNFTPDIIHSHCPVSSTVVARMLRAKTDAPLIFTYHTKFDIDIAKAVKAKFIQKEAVKALVMNIEACDEIWVVSHGAGENLKSLGYSGDYRVMNNGVDFAKGRVKEDIVRDVTADYNLPCDLPVFLYVGRIVDYKGLPMIVKAMKMLDDSGMDFRMVFVGGGPDAESLKQQATEYRLYGGEHDKCIFTGAIYDRDVLRAWNTRADLFIFPSTYDTNGIVVREAAACGLASVLVEGSCAAEGIIHDQNGFLIEESAEGIYHLLLDVCKDMEHVHQVGQNAMDQIYLSWEDSVHTAYERYGEILDLKKSGKLSSENHPLTDQFSKYALNLMEETKGIGAEILESTKEIGHEIKEKIQNRR